MKDLKAEKRLKTDIHLVGRLLRKLPPDTRKDWYKWSSSKGDALTPGQGELQSRPQRC